MLKKLFRPSIITSEMRWNLMNQNVLVSTAMISALWEKHNKDTLDLMIPFMKYAIANTTKVGAKLNLNSVIEIFKTEFGYDSIPYNVVINILNRLSPSILSKKDREYTLIASLDDEYAEFEKKRTQYKEHRSLVGNALAAYLNDNIIQASAFDVQSALQALISFFVENGLVVAQTPEQLTLLKKEKDGKVNYCVGRFLVDEHKKRSEIFDYVTDMVKGFFVSTAISFQPENYTLSHSKFKNLHCYLDTRVIISALGLRLPSAKTAALELLDMLRNEQATICCFEHTVTEIRDIIRAYKHSLLNPNSKTVHNTLENWDEQNYSVEQVTRYLSILEKKIEALGINIVPSSAKKKVKGLKVRQFKDQLREKIHYNSVSAREYDTLSVLGVMYLRNGHTSPELEKCSHLFITTNLPLIYVTNNCLWESSTGVGPVIADTTLSSVVWVKSGASHSDYPAQKLIENAMFALEPSHSFLCDFYEAIDRIQSDGGISAEEAAIIRTDIQIRRDLIREVNGDSTQITNDTIFSIRENLRERLIGENKVVSEENYQRYLSQKAKNEKALSKIIEEIEDCGDERRNIITHRLIKLAWGTMIVFLALLAGFAIAGYVLDKNYWIGSVVLLIANILGFYDLLMSKKHVIKSAICKIAEQSAEKARTKKHNEYANVIEMLSQDNSIEEK